MSTNLWPWYDPVVVRVDIGQCTNTSFIWRLHCLPSHVHYNMQGDTSPLIVASQMGHTEVVNALVQAGADIHQTNKV